MGKGLSRIRCLFLLMDFVRGMRWRFVGIVLVNVLFKLTPVAAGFLGSYLVSLAVTGDASGAMALAAPTIALAVLAGVLSYVDVLVSHDLAYHVLADLRDAAYDKVDQIAPAAMHGARSAEVVSIVLEDVETLEQFYAHTIPQLVVAVVIPVGALVVLGAIHLALPASLLAFIIAIVAIPLRTAGAADEQGADVRRLFGVMNAHVVDGIQGLKDIITFEWAGEYRSRFGASMRDFHAAQMGYAKRSAQEQRAFGLVSSLGALAVEVAAVLLVLGGRMGAVWLMPVFVLSSAVFVPLSDALTISSSLGLIVGCAQRVFGLFGLEPAIADEGSLCEADVLAAADGVTVAFDDVHFAYPADSAAGDGEKDLAEASGTSGDADRVAPGVLRGLSFTVRTGETVALVGASGCGKTTSARLLQRFWDVDSGSISINGVDVRDLGLEALRSLVTVVPQETYLFNESIYKNLLLARPGASDDQVRQAVSDASLDEVVEKLPEGLSTAVGERGLRLSGGERQRIAIAQAILKDAPVLVLDEASASLDSQTERSINEAVDRLKRERATLVIAHRESTIRAADRVVFIHDGRAEAQGTYQELIEGCPAFARLLGEEFGDEGI